MTRNNRNNIYLKDIDGNVVAARRALMSWLAGAVVLVLLFVFLGALALEVTQ